MTERIEQQPGTIKSTIRRGYDHLRVSPQYHLANGALVSVHIAFGFLTHPMWFLTTPVFYKPLKTNIEKASKNLKTYYRTRDALERQGWDDRLMEPLMGWWCTRYAVRKAAIKTGHRREMKRYLREHGYSGRGWLRGRIRS